MKLILILKKKKRGYNKFYETPVLETERLILKRGKPEDFVKVYEYDMRKLRNISGEFEFVKQDPEKVKCFAEPYENSYDWVMFLKENNEPIGNVTTDREREDINSIELAFNLHPNYWRKGYMSEAVIEIMNFLFEKGYDNVICGYDEGNFKSKGVGEKLGFIPFEVHENAWKKNGIPITSYITILSKDRFYELYKEKFVKHI